ncbi:unnamed protein product [Rotaria magnacalcarata]|uniref:Tubulin--tyrosine ligase-like protein 12 SET-like domain-containing protein n=13 Tax=Rotaria magnacalcarata TaxID=392030 RepID=A0A816D1W7_9BILA|nr:unnamed protein product [Rotaria magnacalcarata]CAF1632476.1 unnamed protein product [Rotaria magnacalcarata]CAF1905105.1 unnamed protein product [Rotaria magnacalcarata]
MADNDEYDRFLQTHEFQLLVNNIPKHFYRRLYEKMKNEIFDSGSYFQLCPADDDDEELEGTYNAERRYYVSTLQDIVLDPHNDENAIFLIDHAWTYRIKDARNNLTTIPTLYERMASLMNIDAETKEDGIELVLQRMWKYNQTYTLTSTQVETQRDCEETYEPYWYIMDELGSSIRHSNTNANVCCTSFFFGPSQTMFSIFYPIVRIDQPYTEIFRNFVYDNNETLDRSIRLLPWKHLHARKTFLRHLTIENSSELFNQKLQNSLEIFEKCHQHDLYDKKQILMNDSIEIDQDRAWKVYTDHELVTQYLNDKHYQLIDDPDQADILFVMKQLNEFRHETIENKLISQFPFENIITNKELLALTARRWKSLYGSSTSDNDPYIDSHGSPPWLATTFNLTYELSQFAVYFQYREDQQLDNTWIVKPINLTRSIDMSVTNSLDMIIRLPESGPKIACKYVSSPVLLKIPEMENQSIKFDVRYVILLRSLRPLKLYVHKIFWLRFANKPFSLKELDDYETHFTVMNYRPNAFLRQMNCHTFTSMYNEQYGHNEQWSIVEQRIFQMFRETFQCASIEEPPFGIASCSSSRALYAADLMLEMIDNKVQPKLLEINFTPDCHRACSFYPNFYNQVFNVLFRDITEEQDVIDISV